MPSSATRLINLVGIGLVIGAFSLIPAYIGPALPPAQVLWVRVPGALFVAGWLFLLVRPVPAHGVGRVAWPFSSRFVVWGGIALLTSGFWAWMPYADEGVLLVCMLCQFCTVTLYVPAVLTVMLAEVAPVLHVVVAPGACAVSVVLSPGHRRRSAPRVSR